MPNPDTLGIPQELVILGAAINTGIIDTLKGQALSSQALAKKLKLDSRAVWIVVEALVALDYVKRQGNKYLLTPQSKKMFYDPQSKGYLGFSFMHRYNLVRSWAYLPEIIKTGKPYRGKQDPRHMHYFIEAMNFYARQFAPSIAQFLLKGAQPGTRVVDIGGGPLTLAKEFTKHRATATILDLPEVVKMNQKEAQQFGIRMVPGNFLGKLPSGPFDLAFLGNICHIINERQNLDLFQKVSRILVPGGRIAIVDFIRGTNPGAALFAVNMLVNTDTGGTYTFDQYTAWLKKAGFHQVKLNAIMERQIITAVKK